MKNTFFPAGLFLTFFLFFGCNSSETMSNDPDDFDLFQGELITQSILHNGEEREYFAYVPTSYDKNISSPQSSYKTHYSAVLKNYLFRVSSHSFFSCKHLWVRVLQF